MIAKTKTITLRLDEGSFKAVRQYMDKHGIATMSKAYLQAMTHALRNEDLMNLGQQEYEKLAEDLRVKQQSLEEVRIACQRVVELADQSDMFSS
jgi:hypothetical protein